MTRKPESVLSGQALSCEDRGVPASWAGA